MGSDYDPIYESFQDELNHAVYRAIVDTTLNYKGYFQVSSEILESLLINSVNLSLENFIDRYIESDEYLELFD